MAKVVYEVVEHDGGYAYKVGDVFSETYATHEAAHQAAEEAAQRQQLGDRDEMIEYQDSQGRWHNEVAPGDRRPDTEVKDDLDAEDTADEEDYPNPNRAPFITNDGPER